KRKYPYRKVPDIEADIAAAETELRQVEELLASPDLYRGGGRVKPTTKAFEETKARLQQVYGHWGEGGEPSWGRAPGGPSPGRRADTPRTPRPTAGPARRRLFLPLSPCQRRDVADAE